MPCIVVFKRKNCAIRQNTFYWGGGHSWGVIQKNSMSLGGQEENVSSKENSPPPPWLYKWKVPKGRGRQLMNFYFMHCRTFAIGPQKTTCWFHGSSFKGFSIVFPAPWLAKVESSQKSNGMWFLRHFFAPFLSHRSKNNRLDKLRSTFWREKMFRKPHLKLLRWFSVHGTNKNSKSSRVS